MRIIVMDLNLRNDNASCSSSNDYFEIKGNFYIN